MSLKSWVKNKLNMNSKGVSNKIEKHRRIHGILCCPNCHGELAYPNSFRLCRLPFVGNVVCSLCGSVGVVANGRTLFNASDLNYSLPAESELSCSVEQSSVDLNNSERQPLQAWHKNDSSFWSHDKSSRFVFKTDALGLGLTLLKHPWSGIAEIHVDDVHFSTIDLFEEAGSMRHWVPIYLGQGKHVVEVVVVGEKNPKSQDVQVHILELEVLNISRLGEPGFYYSGRNRGNGYPERFDSLLADLAPDALVLDCGSGDRNHVDSRVIGFEYSRFQGPDVFGDGHKLPFKDGSFDLVLSQAVIEHLYDPFIAAKEIFRVLKPGGLVYVESAFMQPLHAVPFHFFNTTAWGLERLFNEFEVIKVTHEGHLADTLEWFYKTTRLKENGFSEKVEQLLALARQLDTHITHDEMKSFASYVTLLGKRPCSELREPV